MTTARIVQCVYRVRPARVRARWWFMEINNRLLQGELYIHTLIASRRDSLIRALPCPPSQAEYCFQNLLRIVSPSFSHALYKRIGIRNAPFVRNFFRSNIKNYYMRFMLVRLESYSVIPTM